MNEVDYEDLPHDELLSLAEGDPCAAEEFYYRYQYSDDPNIEKEVHAVLKSLAVDFDLMGFWLDWYDALRDSDDPQEQREAEVWKRKILDDGGFEEFALLDHGIIDYDELPHDELLNYAKSNLLAASAFYLKYRGDENPQIKEEARSMLKSLAEGGMIDYWLDWFYELKTSDNPADRQEAEKWKRKIREENAWDSEWLKVLGIEDSPSAD